MCEDSGLHKPALATGHRGAVPLGWGQIPRDFLAGKIRELQDETAAATPHPAHTGDCQGGSHARTNSMR